MKIKQSVRKLLYLNIQDTFSLLMGKKYCLNWFNPKKINNLGDAINPFIFYSIFNKYVVNYNNIFNFMNRPVYYMIGSILDNLNDKNAIIIGAGFIEDKAKIYKKPKKIIAVRGPLTREIFIKYNINCPEIYCDPTLLLPFFIKKPIVEKKYDIGIIAHYADKHMLKK